MNLKEETIFKLAQYDKSPEDVLWIGTRNHYIDTNEFWRLADVEYDSGWGAPEVADNLLVVGENWWMERHEYDGSEWWEFKSMPTKPDDWMYVRTLVNGCWSTLEELNEEV